MRYERVKYKLINNDLGVSIWLSHDPDGWDESEKTLKRSTKTYGIFTELSKNLEFTEEGAEFLRLAYSGKEIEANVVLEEWRAYPDRDGLYLHSTGVFDFSDYQSTRYRVKVPFKTGGLNAIIESQLREKFELDRTESINGKLIDDLFTYDVALEQREIFLQSTWKIFYPNGYVGSFNNTGQWRAIKMLIESDSGDGNIQDVYLDNIDFNPSLPFQPSYLDVQAGHYFLVNANEAKSLRIRGSWTVEILTSTNTIYDVYLLQTNNIDEVKSWTLLYGNESINVGVFNYNVEFEHEIDIDVTDNLAIVTHVLGNVGGNRIISEVRYTDFKLYSLDKTIYEQTQAKAVLMHEAGEKLMQILTGEKGRFYSEFYGRTDIGYKADGEFAYTGLTTGFWIRQFTEEKMELSIDNFIGSSNAIHNTGYTVEDRISGETLVMEDMKYFFQNEITIRLPEQVSNVERKAASEMYYANMLFGYKEPSGDNLYEEAMGLDEYNIQIGYTNPITRVDNKYLKESDARADSYGIEFARRKSIERFPNQDTRYDKSVFLLDLIKSIGNALRQRLWADDFEQAPKGVYSPETATNLRLTPFRMLERHGWFFGSGLKKFPNEYVKYANSVGNSNLITKKAGEPERIERGDIQISELEYPRFINEWITFDYEVDYYINKQVYEKTNINGRSVPNYFGKVEFINELGLKEYGYLFELKPNGAGRWKLLKAY